MKTLATEHPELVLTPIPVLDEAHAAVAGRFLREAAEPPVTAAACAAFRYRWGPWLWGTAEGPTVPNVHRLVA